MKHLLLAAAVVTVIVTFTAPASAGPGARDKRTVVLITEDEARQAEAPAKAMGFGSSEPSDGPVITFNKPTYGSEVSPPVAIDITFAKRLAPVDLASLKVTYLKFINIDITDRVKDYATADGIKIANAELPAGSHKVRFTIKDTENNQSEEVLKLTILDE